jgi:hypothetical protein
MFADCQFESWYVYFYNQSYFNNKTKELCIVDFNTVNKSDDF